MHNLQIKAMDHSMPPEWTNRLPPRSADERGRAQMISVLIGRDTRSLASRITPGSVTPRVLVEVHIKEVPDHGNRIIDENQDPLPNKQRGYDNNPPEPNQSAYDNDTPTAPFRINLEKMVMGQQKMIKFLFQHKTKLLERY